MGEEEKGDPIPTRFDPPEEKMIQELARRTGLSRSDIIRRCVRYAGNVIAEEGPSILYELPVVEYALKRKQAPKKK